jgi:hypothetical protein
MNFASRGTIKNLCCSVYSSQILTIPCNHMTSRNFPALDRLQLSHLLPRWSFELKHQQRDDEGKAASAEGFQWGKAQCSLGETPQESHAVHSSRMVGG